MTDRHTMQQPAGRVLEAAAALLGADRAWGDEEVGPDLERVRALLQPYPLALLWAAALSLAGLVRDGRGHLADDVRDAATLPIGDRERELLAMAAEHLDTGRPLGSVPHATDLYPHAAAIHHLLRIAAAPDGGSALRDVSLLDRLKQQLLDSSVSAPAPTLNEPASPQEWTQVGAAIAALALASEPQTGSAGAPSWGAAQLADLVDLVGPFAPTIHGQLFINALLVTGTVLHGVRDGVEEARWVRAVADAAVTADSGIPDRPDHLVQVVADGIGAVTLTSAGDLAAPALAFPGAAQELWSCFAHVIRVAVLREAVPEEQTHVLVHVARTLSGISSRDED